MWTISFRFSAAFPSTRRRRLKFTYQRPPVEGDTFFSTMRELARKVRE